ncbi:MAG: cyclic nucleotide-gated ion channel [Propylenella sp.]
MVGAENSSPKEPVGSVAAQPARLWQWEPAGERLLAVVGILAFLAGSLPNLSRAYEAALTVLCLAVALLFAALYVLRLVKSPARLGWALSTPGIIDLLAAAPVPLALLLGAPSGSARLLGVFWALKLIRMNPAFTLFARVLRNERQPLVSVTTVFAVVILFAATIIFVLEQPGQPGVYDSVPSALWWAVTTVTTTGYGDKVPITFAGRVLAGAVMVSGIGLFALWAGILASGFAQELRRREFLESWDLVVQLPLFRSLGAPALSEIAHLLKVQNAPADSAIVRQGQPADSMYFIAEGEVEVRRGAEGIRLAAGQFFGETALITGGTRNASVVAVTPARLLRLDVTDFRGLAARQPELLRVIEAENARRQGSG